MFRCGRVMHRTSLPAQIVQLETGTADCVAIMRRSHHKRPDLELSMHCLVIIISIVVWNVVGILLLGIHMSKCVFWYLACLNGLIIIYYR
jgi:hypothetical protein